MVDLGVSGSRASSIAIDEVKCNNGQSVPHRRLRPLDRKVI